jgi:hypothetical protein
MTASQATLYILDVVNGTIEYDLIRQPGKSFDVRDAVGSFDERCPQTSNFSIIRCTGHQHIGKFPVRAVLAFLRIDPRLAAVFEGDHM